MRFCRWCGVPVKTGALTCSPECAEKFAALCEAGAKRMTVLYEVDGKLLTREGYERRSAK